MAKKMNLSTVVHGVNDTESDVSDWDLSEDELVGADDEGALDGQLRTLTSPLDLLEDSESMENIPAGDDSDTLLPPPSSIVEDPVRPGVIQPIRTSCPIPHSVSVDPLDHPLFTRRTGRQLILNKDDHPHEFFEAIFGSDTFDHIATQTNLYASQSGATWEPTSGAEVKAFLGILLAMGIHRLPFLRDHWSQHPLLGAPGITQIMPHVRFKEILRSLRINDNTTALPRNDANYDKLH